jgi:hypothetical protein
MEAIAQSDSPVNRSTGVQQLQWSAVDVDAAQFEGVRNLAVNALGCAQWLIGPISLF